jgi:hypothetical protein
MLAIACALCCPVCFSPQTLNIINPAAAAAAAVAAPAAAAASWPTFPEGIYLDCAPNPALVGQNETCKGGFSINAYLQQDVTCCFRTQGARGACVDAFLFGGLWWMRLYLHVAC